MPIDLPTLLAASRRNGFDLTKRGVRRRTSVPRDARKREILVRCIVAYATRRISFENGIARIGTSS